MCIWNPTILADILILIVKLLSATEVLHALAKSGFALWANVLELWVLTRERDRNGSYVLEPCRQVEQTTFDRSLPPNNLKITDLSSYFLMTLSSFPKDAFMMLCSSVMRYSWASSYFPVSKFFQTLLIATIIEVGFKADVSYWLKYSLKKELISQNAQLACPSHHEAWESEMQ